MMVVSRLKITIFAKEKNNNKINKQNEKIS